MKLLGRGCWRRLLPAKLLLVMRITTAILLISALHVSATGVGQTISYSGKEVPLEKVFAAIKQQTGYVFFYKLRDLEGARPVTVDLNNVPLEAALEKILQNQSLSFSIQGNTIFINLKTPTAVLQSVDSLPRKVVKAMGTVLNESGQPLAGANVTVKETKRGAITNVKGEFELAAVPIHSTLVISFIGYTNQELIVSDKSNLSIKLKIAKNELDKVVIQAYGTTTQRLTTSDISTVTSAEIERQPVMNPLLALQGKVAGLDVSQINGYASAPLKVEIRGRNAINSQFPSDPLYIIDGVPLTILEISGNSNYATGSYGFLQSGMGSPANGQSPFFNIDPADIESIEVLKDADATAIYGSRGANGVILITTKKGRAGKNQFNLHINQGINKVTRYWSMMNTQQYLAMRREAYNNDGLAPTLANGAYDLDQWDTTKYTNWQKALYGGTGKATDVEGSFSGGDAYNTFRIGAGYANSTDILTVSGANQRGSLSLSVDHHSADQRFGLSVSSSYSFTDVNMISLPSSAIILPPDAPPIYDSAGNLNFAGWGTANSQTRGLYPFGNLKQHYDAKTNFLNSSLGFNYQPVRGLKLIATFGYNNALALQQQLTPIASQDPVYNPTGSAQFANNRNTNWIIEPQVSYNAALSKGKIDLLAGGSIQEATTDGSQTYGSGYSSDQLLQTISNASRIYASDLYGQYRYAAIFGRVGYNWENKYILNLNARRDGSSRFGPGKQFGDFGSIGGAWIFTEEQLFKNMFRFLSFGKLRGSYGTTGSDAIGDYGYLTRWSSSGLLPYNGIQPLVPTQHADPNFQWQVNKKLEGAIDLGFVQDKVHLVVAYYRNRCGNQLVSFPLPAFTGFTSVDANWPALVQNDGWEFTAGAKVVDVKNFSWTINFNTAINNNKLLAYPNIAQSPYAHSLVVGQSLNMIQKLHYIGVDPQTGLYSFQDKNHDGQIIFQPGNPDNDAFYYNLSPKFFGGVGMNFSYKSVQLSLFFNFKDQIGNNAYLLSGNYAGSATNAPTEIVGKEWKNPGEITSFGKFTNSPNNGSLANNSDLSYTDASFIRLSNLSLSYGLPASYIKKVGMRSCSVFFHTNNIFVITHYKGLDPETQSFGGMPPQKILVGGLSLDF